MSYRESTKGKQSEVVTVTKSEWKTIGVRIKAKDLPLFNRRLSLYGFETLGSLVADFLTGKFPVITEDRQITPLVRTDFVMVHLKKVSPLLLQWLDHQ